MLVVLKNLWKKFQFDSTKYEDLKEIFSYDREMLLKFNFWPIEKVGIKFLFVFYITTVLPGVNTIPYQQLEYIFSNWSDFAIFRCYSAPIIIHQLWSWPTLEWSWSRSIYSCSSISSFSFTETKWKVWLWSCVTNGQLVINYKHILEHKILLIYWFIEIGLAENIDQWNGIHTSLQKSIIKFQKGSLLYFKIGSLNYAAVPIVIGLFKYYFQKEPSQLILIYRSE